MLNCTQSENSLLLWPSMLFLCFSDELLILRRGLLVDYHIGLRIHDNDLSNLDTFQSWGHVFRKDVIEHFNPSPSVRAGGRSRQNIIQANSSIGKQLPKIVH